MSLKQILQEEDKQKQNAVNLQDAKYKVLGSMRIRCAGNAYGRATYQNGCGKLSLVRRWGWQKGLYYNYNTGSPDGPYWAHGNPDTDSLLCPHCGKENYIYNHPEKDKIIEIHRLAGWNLERVFKNVTEKQEKG